MSIYSHASIAVVENAEQLVKFKQIRQELPGLKAIVMMTGFDGDEQVFSWDDLPRIAEKIPKEALDKRMAAQKPDDCCTLIYTSGTTGNPKGVMLSHDNIIWTGQQVVAIGDKRKYITALFTLDPEKIDQTAQALKSRAKNSKEASQCKNFNDHLQREVDRINSTLPNVQTIKKFVILPEEFSIEGDELTPTMKLKRRIINKKYKTQIESMYG